MKSRTRGIENLKRCIGDIRSVIDARLAVSNGTPLRVLELGFGHGNALLDLMSLYGSKLELHGVNFGPESGSIETLQSRAEENGIFEIADGSEVRWPTLYYFDAGKKWPLPDDSFDLVYSQSTLIWLRDKITAIEETNRVLAPGGMGLIDIRLLRRSLPPQFACSLVVWDEGKTVPFEKYITSFPNLRMRMPAAGQKWSLRNKFFSRNEGKVSGQPYIEIIKGPSLELNLFLAAVVPLRNIHPGWPGGYQSIYRVNSEPEASLANKKWCEYDTFSPGAIVAENKS